MEKFRTVCHSNGYPCGWEKMGLNNMSLMSAGAVSGNVSEEMSPAISASNHLMGQQISTKWMYWSIPGLDRWNEPLRWQNRERQEGEKRPGCKQGQIKTRLSRFIQLHSVPLMFVCSLSADTDRNFNYFIRREKWKDLSVVISAVFYRSI